MSAIAGLFEKNFKKSIDDTRRLKNVHQYDKEGVCAYQGDQLQTIILHILKATQDLQKVNPEASFRDVASTWFRVCVETMEEKFALDVPQVNLEDMQYPKEMSDVNEESDLVLSGLFIYEEMDEFLKYNGDLFEMLNNRPETMFFGKKINPFNEFMTQLIAFFEVIEGFREKVIRQIEDRSSAAIDFLNYIQRKT